MMTDTPDSVTLVPIDRIEVLNSRDRNMKVFEEIVDNIRAIGHGTSSIMDAGDAISRAHGAVSIAPTGVAAHEPQGLSVGQSVTIRPDVNGGEQPVVGTIRYADAQTVVIERSADDVGTVCVHFPRAGYRIDTA